NLCFHRFANHNFHAFALCQYLHSFYFLALFDYEIACPLVQLISLFAFYKLHNSYVNRSFLGGTNVRHFRSEEHTSELQSRFDLVCRLLLEKKKQIKILTTSQRMRTSTPCSTTAPRKD